MQMDREYVERHGLVDRYLRGMLTAAEAAAFEAHYLECAETMEEVEQGWALQQGLRASPRRREWKNRLLPPVFRDRPVAAAAAFAAVAAAVLVPGLVVLSLLQHNRALEQQVTALASPQANLPVVTLFNTRAHDGDIEDASLRVGEGQRTVLFEVDPGAGGVPPFTLSIFRPGAEAQRVTVSGLQRDDRGYLVSAVPVERLQQGRHRVEVISSAGQAVAEFAVDVVKESARSGNSGG